MLTNKHLREEIKDIESAIEKSSDPSAKAVLKSLTLILKMLHSIRTNQVSIMIAEGVPKIKVNREDEKEE